MTETETLALLRAPDIIISPLGSKKSPGGNSLTLQVQAKKKKSFLERQKLLSERLETKEALNKMNTLAGYKHEEALLKKTSSSSSMNSDAKKKRRYSIASKFVSSDNIGWEEMKKESERFTYTGISDCFQTKVTGMIFKMSSSYYELEASGALRENYLKIVNYDLFIYPSKHSNNPNLMVVLGKGCLVKPRQPVSLSID